MTSMQMHRRVERLEEEAGVSRGEPVDCILLVGVAPGESPREPVSADVHGESVTRAALESSAAFFDRIAGVARERRPLGHTVSLVGVACATHIDEASDAQPAWKADAA